MRLGNPRSVGGASSHSDLAMGVHQSWLIVVRALSRASGTLSCSS